MQDLFPYDEVRREQDKFIAAVTRTLAEKNHLIVHAPTGLGKTAGVLAPAISHAIQNNLNVLFLTSRHTQHILAVDTVREMAQKHKTEIISADVIGKKWMCAQGGVSELYANEFNEYCKKMREEKTCEFHENIKNKSRLSVRAEQLLKELTNTNLHAENVAERSSEQKLCPYDMTILIAEKSRIIIADYYYVFHPTVSEQFLKRANKDLGSSIIIVDEAHNLPYRIRDLASTTLTSNIIERAIKEAKKFKYNDLIRYINLVQDAMNHFLKDREQLVSQADFQGIIEKEIGVRQLAADLEFTADAIREEQRLSYIGSIAGFLKAWLGPVEGFARILKYTQGKRPGIKLSNTCLDPGLVAKPVIENSYSTILMSGTLTPPEMYRDILGYDDAATIILQSPFPDRNRLNLVIPKTTTKFTSRTDAMYKQMAKICAEITGAVPGNSILFFPSYSMLKTVNEYFSVLSKKTVMQEDRMLNKKERKEMLDKFKGYEKSGAVLLAVASGSFSEGIDLPGDYLKCVVVVGLPLTQPDLETKELIKYYDEKFEKGWDYGYIFPAFNKALQSAGRCIRSETDKGVVVFLDERYLWPRYARLFPQDWEMEVSRDHVEEIEEFFI